MSVSVTLNDLIAGARPTGVLFVVGVEAGNIIKLIQLMIFGSEIVVINLDQDLQQINHKNSQEIKNEA